MQENRLRKLKIRRGNDNQRKVTLFEEGELVFVKDTERVYVGDDTTVGGNRISNKNYFTVNSIKPIGAETEDLYFDEIDKSTYMINLTGGSTLIIPSVLACCVNIKKDIDIIDSLLKRISGECCGPDNFLATDLDNPPIFLDNILTDNSDTIRVK
jgi:hypothetical protein